MNIILRTLFISRLIENIRVVAPGALFERFGGMFLEHYLGIPLSHHGLNVLGHPVGGAVDTASHKGDYIAEYSSEKTYFKGSMKKAWSDIRHALEKHPDTKKILLFSSQEVPAGRRDAILRNTGRCQRKHKKEIQLFDSRRIAEEIVDHLLFNDAAIEQLIEFIPILKQIRDEHAANHLVPAPSERYVNRVNIEQAILTHLKAETCTILSGIGGSGKSQCASAIATAERDNYDLIIWLDAKDLQIEHLRAVRLTRSGEMRDITTLLKTLRCLLVLDDLNTEITPDQLVPLCGSGSHILVTRRTGGSQTFQIPPLDKIESKAILNRDLPEPCAEETFIIIWSAVGGHPFTLGLINAAVAEGAPWSDIADDCRSAGELANDQERVADRVLNRLLPLLSREFSLFSWANQSSCDRGFIRDILGPGSVRKLERHCLTTPDSPSVIRIHDIVYASIRAQTLPNLNYIKEFDAALDTYIRKIAYTHDLSFTAVVYNMKSKLETLVRDGNKLPSYIYCLLHSWEPAEIDEVLIGDPMKHSKALTKYGEQANEIDVAVIFEIIEGLYRKEKENGSEAAKEKLKSFLPVFEHLIASKILTDRSVAETQHHLAKCLNLLDQKEEAIEIFEKILTGLFPLHESRLQLVRIYARTKDNDRIKRAIKLAEEIFSEAQSTTAAVTTSVLLAAAEALPWGALEQGREKIITDYSQMIGERIIAAAFAGSMQPYQTFSSIGRYWAWNDPDRFLHVWRNLPPRSVAEINRDDERFAYGDILREAAVRMQISIEECNQLQAEALTYFQAIKKPNAFQIRKLGQLFVEMKRWDEAITTLFSVDINQEPWRSYWLSKAFLGAGKFPKALEAINFVFTKVTNTDKYWSTYKETRYDIRIALKEENAIEDLRDAVIKCTSDRYKNDLSKRLRQAEATHN